jgi:hypothetical protein
MSPERSLSYLSKLHNKGRQTGEDEHTEEWWQPGSDLLRIAESSRGEMLYSLERERAIKECWRNHTEINKTKRKTSFQDIERDGDGEEDDNDVEYTQER